MPLSHHLVPTILIMSPPASSNPFISSPASSGYATAEVSPSPVIMNYGWAEPLYRDETFPPHLKHDDMAIVNPDYWDEGVDQNTFKGWMRMTEVGASFSSLSLIGADPLCQGCTAWYLLINSRGL